MIDAEAQHLLDDSVVNLRVAAVQVSRRYRNIASYSDLYQDGIGWVLKHPATVQARLDDGRRGSTRLTGMIAQHMDGLARRLKAHSGGYNVEDEVFYNRGMVEAALPAVWDQSLASSPPVTDDDGVHSRGDPSTQGNWLAMVMDVRRAWYAGGMDPKCRSALLLRFGSGFLIREIADELDCAVSTAHAALGRGCRSLVNNLGGPAPLRCQPDCECVPVGGRRVVSNATANNWTEREQA